MSNVDLDKLMEIRNKGLIKELGIEITECRPGYAKGQIEIGPKHMNPIGSVHGGVLFSLCDTVGGTAGTSYGQALTTVNGSIDYLRPTIGATRLVAESLELKKGKKICVYDVNVYDQDGRIVARGTMTYMYLEKVADKEFEKGLKTVVTE